MGQIIIRRLSDEAVERLRIHAADSGAPLESYLRKLLEREAKQPNIAEMRKAHDRLTRLWKQLPSEMPDSVPDLRALRER